MGWVGQARPQGGKFCLGCLDQGANGTLASELPKGLCDKVESEFLSLSVFVNSVIINKGVWFFKSYRLREHTLGSTSLLG